MSEPTKALLIVIAIPVVPVIGYVLYIFFSERNKFKNAIHVDFKKSKGKMKGYVKNKNGEWIYDDSLHLEDEVNSKDSDQA